MVMLLPKVSVIVPVYNAKEFLTKCLTSLVGQTLTAIEIICIDDGSTDQTGSILQHWAKCDSRIKILQQLHQKQGAARNRGLEIAQGEFITFVDADDWVDRDYLAKLYAAACKYQVNMAVASMTRDKKYKVKFHLKLVKQQVYRGSSAIIQGIDNHLETAGKLYKRAVIQTLRFAEGTLYEDALYTIQALHACATMVTVPDTIYHYVSNSHSTIKQKLNIKNELDKITTSLAVKDYAKKELITIKDTPVFKERHFLWSIKHYLDRQEFYIAGIKLFSRRVPFKRERIFLVFNTACFGDVLLCSPLCQTIKQNFSPARVVFITDQPYADAARYQSGVDEVIVYDKRGVNRGFWGLVKFVWQFPYRHIFAAIITYKNERNWLIAKLLRSRFVLMQDYPAIDQRPTQFKHISLLQKLTNKKLGDLPMKYYLPECVPNIVSASNYLVLCTTSKNKIKDMPIDDAVSLINLINRTTAYQVVLVGVGQVANDYANALNQRACRYLNLVNRTSILELGAVLRGSKCLISVDTGTLHFGAALNIPVIAIFYEQQNVVAWAPRPQLYRSTIIAADYSAERIVESIKETLRYY